MLSFLKIGVFRKKFILYIVVLLLLCTALCFGVCAAFLNARAAALRQDALNAFERVEGGIIAATDDIESYVLRIYRSASLANDMEALIGSSMEGYLSRRLDNPADTPSIIDSIQEYAATPGAAATTQISLHGEKNATVFEFGRGQIDIRFLVDNQEPMLQKDIRQGYTHTRPLASTLNTLKIIGEMRFLLDADTIFAPAKQYGLPNAAVLDGAGNCYVISREGDFDPALYAVILSDGYGQGSIKNGVNSIQYAVHTSSLHNYRLVMAYDSAYLLRQNGTLVIAVIAGTLATFLAIILLIALNMRHDAEFLSQIIGTIDKAKTATFRPISKQYKGRNEYGMIADSLNDMNLKLKEHIRTEYLLKLRQQETEMKALQHQINPHFLYNTLEIIRSAAVVNKDDQVADAITNLGQLYRGITRAGATVTLREEVEILNAYLDLMAFRYKGNFSYRTEIDPGMAGIETVKFWMQPIAENFFAHGYDSGSEFNLFLLNGFIDENGWTIEMMDNGPGIAHERLEELNGALALEDDVAQEGVGLRNVYMRLRYYYGSALSMHISNNPDAGITVTIHVSKKEAADV